MTASELCASCSRKISARHIRVVADDLPYHSGCAPRRAKIDAKQIVVHPSADSDMWPELGADPVVDPLGFYGALGLNPDASQDQIKDRYRRLSSALHPDRAGGDSDRYARISAAYDVLGDPEARAKYDVTGAKRPSDDRVRAAAVEVLMVCFNRFVEQVSDPATSSMIKFCQDVIQNIEANNSADIRANVSKKERLMTIRRRIKAPSGHPLLRSIDEKLRAVIQQLAAGEERQLALARARIDLSKIDYQVDEDPFELPNEMRQFLRPSRAW